MLHGDGLASVGFRGRQASFPSNSWSTAAVHANVYIGIAVAVAGMLNGIAVVRAYFLLFLGARHNSTVNLQVGIRERIAVLTLTALILVGGLFPQPGVESRQHAAEALLKARHGDSDDTMSNGEN